MGEIEEHMEEHMEEHSVFSLESVNLRGGSWKDHGCWPRVGIRGNALTDRRTNDIGFRFCVQRKSMRKDYERRCRVLWGGSWGNCAYICRGTDRLWDLPEDQSPRKGFRFIMKGVNYGKGLHQGTS